jgi:hypothetical protein
VGAPSRLAAPFTGLLLGLQPNRLAPAHLSLKASKGSYEWASEALNTVYMCSVRSREQGCRDPRAGLHFNREPIQVASAFSRAAKFPRLNLGCLAAFCSHSGSLC